jgi:polar amino acid transport system permease protein
VLPAQVYLCLGLTYFLLCFGLSRLAVWIERRLTPRGPSAGTKAEPAGSNTLATT